MYHRCRPDVGAAGGDGRGGGGPDARGGDAGAFDGGATARAARPRAATLVRRLATAPQASGGDGARGGVGGGTRRRGGAAMVGASDGAESASDARRDGWGTPLAPPTTAKGREVGPESR